MFPDFDPLFFVCPVFGHSATFQAFSKTLVEEGARIKSFPLVVDGVFDTEGITALLQEPATLPRGPDELPVR